MRRQDNSDSVQPERLAWLGGFVSAVAEQGLNWLLPPRCLGCGEDVARAGALCSTCWQQINFVAPPHCVCCGRPFEFAADPDSRCGPCLADPPPFSRARTVMQYDDASRGMLLAFKHGDRTDAADGFARWLGRAGAELLTGPGEPLLVPVPLHRWRLFARRYNQSALLALALARQSGLTAVPDLLVRRRSTPSQGGLSRSGRARNVAGAFTIRPRHRSTVTGRRIVLVDDVLTTGATVRECTRVLLHAGAIQVDVLTLARVVKAVVPE
jgi:ComF family protein